MPSLLVLTPAAETAGVHLDTQDFLGLALAVASATSGSSGQ